MPTVSTRSKSSLVRIGRSKSTGARRVARKASARSGRRTEYVRVPRDEYERLLLNEMAQEALAEPDGPTVSLEDTQLLVAADRIVNARKAAGMTQQQLAAKLKMPQSQISRIERNPDRTTVRTLKKIAKALKVDVRFLI